MTTHAAVFLSKGAGALADADAERAEERLAAALRSSGYDPDVVRLEGGEIENAARRAADEGADVVIVCGGDGSVAAAASALVGRSTPLAILPMGTRNHFARDLALPLDGEEAARALRQSAVRAVDVGEVNGRVFINTAYETTLPELGRRPSLTAG